jgi:complex III assembly factor LYRM7
LALEAAEILRRNVVQGVMKEGEGIFRLRIHDEIEKGDNASVKFGGGRDGGKCCSR